MPKDITKGVERLSLHSDESTSSQQKKPRAKKWYKKEEWVYGFNLKNRYVSRLAKRYNLPWETHPGAVLTTVQTIIGITSCVMFRARYLYHRGRPTLILFFAEDDGRKRLKRSTIPKEEMDEVRKAMYLPRGTKPRWYDVHGGEVDNRDAESSSDDDWPTEDELDADENDFDREDELEGNMHEGGADSGGHGIVKG